MATDLPMRFRVLHYFSHVSHSSLEDLMAALKAEYGSEGQFNQSVFEEHLMSLRAGGLLQSSEASLDSQGNLIQKFAITEFGKSRLKYLPKHWKS